MTEIFRRRAPNMAGVPRNLNSGTRLGTLAVIRRDDNDAKRSEEDGRLE